MSDGQADVHIPLPRVGSAQDLVLGATDYIELYIYNGWNQTIISQVVFSDISISYKPSINQYKDKTNTNRYAIHIGEAMDDVSIQQNLGTTFGNVNGLSHIYGINTYYQGSGGETVEYFDAITELSYALIGGTTETRRPEVDLLNRLAAYYGAARQTLELKVKHPTVAALPLLKLNGINDGKVYLPLAESRDWIADVATLKCFETPE